MICNSDPHLSSAALLICYTTLLNSKTQNNRRTLSTIEIDLFYVKL